MARNSNVFKILLSCFLLLFLICFTLFTVFSLGINTRAAQQHTTHLETATYLGSASNDYAGGVEFDIDGNILVAVNTTTNFGQTPLVLDGGGNGAIIKLNRAGTQVLSVTRIAEWIDDLTVHYTLGNVAVATNDGIKVLSPDLQTVIFTDQINSAGSGFGGSIEVLTNGRRVAFGQNDQVAFLSNKEFGVYQMNGIPMLRSSIGNSRVNAIALDSTNQTIYLGGDTQLDSGSCGTYRSPFIKAIGYSLSEKFNAYNPTNNQAGAANNSCADSQIVDLHIGRDGRFYAIGYSDGGNTIFRQDPYNLNNLCNCQVNITENPSVTPGNQYTSLSNSGVGNYSWIFQFDLYPNSLDIVKTQVHVARLEEGGNANSLSLRDIKVDLDGTIAVVGDSAFLYAHRDLQRTSIKDTPVQSQANGTYAGDAITMIISANMDIRKTGTSNQLSGGQGGRFIAIQDGHWVNLGILSNGSQIYTGNAIQDSNAGGRELFMNVLALPDLTTSSSSVYSPQSSIVSQSSQSENLESSQSNSQQSEQSSTHVSSEASSSEEAQSSQSQSQNLSSETSSPPSSQSYNSQLSSSNESSLFSSESNSQNSSDSSSDQSINSIFSSQTSILTQSSNINSQAQSSTPVPQSSNMSMENSQSSQISQSLLSASLMSSAISSLGDAMNILRLQTPTSVPRGSSVIIATTQIRLSNGQIAANYPISIIIINQNGNLTRLQTTTDSQGNLTSCNIGGSESRVGFWEILSPITTYACPVLTDAMLQTLQNPGAYSAYLEFADSGNTIRSNTINWSITNPTTTARTGGWSLATGAMLILIMGLLAYIYQTSKKQEI